MYNFLGLGFFSTFFCCCCSWRGRSRNHWNPGQVDFGSLVFKWSMFQPSSAQECVCSCWRM